MRYSGATRTLCSSTALTIGLILIIWFTASFSPAYGEDSKSQRFNIVLILVDDAALMDFGAYGGEASTPNIDVLAQRGAMFTQYRTSPLCSPTRAMLLTGMDNHLTGMATIPEVLPDEHTGRTGYTMSLEPGVLTVADRLRSAGYRTLMSGKWHLGGEPGDLPNDHGFDRSLALPASGADNWEDKSYMPYYANAGWAEDGKPVSLPEDFYSSRFLVDRMISYLDTTDSDKPFFAYLPFQAIHIPVQVSAEFISHYDGVYDAGWHALRAARHERAQVLGLIPEGAPLAPMPPNSRDWNSLSDVDRTLYTARMQTNAGMLEAMDSNIGRFIDHLKKIGAYQRTIFVVASDNGPEPSRGDNSSLLGFWMSLNGYHVSLEGMGERGSWGFIGPEWANAAASPGDLYKFYASEGGVRAPLIIAGPDIAPQTINSPAMVTDIAPTLLDWVDAAISSDESAPMTGRSLLPVLTGVAESVYRHNDVRAIEVSGNSALYKGDHKITRSVAPVGDGRWRLFDLSSDPGETTDLAEIQVEVMRDMLAAYDAYAAEVGVLEMPEGYDSIQQIGQNIAGRLLERYLWIILIAVLGLLAALYGLWRVLRGLYRSKRA
jgi:arylsulfatase A-like enzyme